MGLPTLLKTNSIVPKLTATQKEKVILANTKGIDYIMDFISDRIPIAKGMMPKIRPKSIGDKVIILKSATGSGKSTTLPPFLYEKFQPRTNKNIIVTQPRILTSITLAEGTPEHYPFMKLDINLGYLTGPLKRRISDKGIIYATVGVLLQQLKSTDDEQFMKKYSFILIDEVHDRSIETDMALFLLKKLLNDNWENPECPMIILMSATFNEKTFIDYFECPEPNYFEVAGLTFPIESNFSKFDVPNYIDYAVKTAKEIHIQNIKELENNSEFRDILIFVQGAKAMKDIIEKLHIFNINISKQSLSNILDKVVVENENTETRGGNDNKYFIAPIMLNKSNFDSGGAEYQNLFSNINDISIPIYKLDQKGKIDTGNIDRWVKPLRRIIVATNIAETGVTIETLKYCIDTGWQTSVEFNPDFGSKLLIDKNVTRGMSVQRKGRVGRKSPGIWYPCYTEKVFNLFPIDQFAHILTNDITETILSIIMKETETNLLADKRYTLSTAVIKEDKLFKIHYLSDKKWYKLQSTNKLNIASVDFLETPSAGSLNYSVEKLYGLGFINNNYEPTILGYYGNLIRKIPIECKRMIMAGYSYGANILDLITISAFIIVEPRNLYNRKYSPINLLKPMVSDKDYEFYYKVIIGCEFVEFLLIWEHYGNLLDDMIDKNTSENYKFSIKNVKKWCEDNKIEYDYLLNITAVRNEIIENFISLGLNPYYNGMGIEKGSYGLLNILKNNLDEGLSEIKKIKKCVLDGYRFNLTIWDDESKQYMLKHKNIPIQICPSRLISRMGGDAEQYNPKFLILSSIMIRNSQKNREMYEFMSTGSISIMDQYVDVDLNYLLH
jgi:HrpA-like RNA helicase